MYQATIPDNEPMRLATLHTSQLLNCRGNEQFNRLIRLGRRLLQMPICALHLVDAEQQLEQRCAVVGVGRAGQQAQ